MGVSITDIMYSMNKLGVKDEEFRNWVSKIVNCITVVQGIDIDSYTVSPDGNKVWLAFEDPDDEYNALEVCLQNTKIDGEYITLIRIVNVTEFWSTFTVVNICDIVCHITNEWSR